jgi:hypothetical protein
MADLLLLPILLQRGHYWAAENVLEICFRRNDKVHHAVDIVGIWKAIDEFVRIESTTVDERTLWAQVAVLQTFCEGTLRHQLPHAPDATTNAHDSTLGSLEHATQRIANLREEILARSSDDAWTHTRASMRQDLIMIDNTTAKRAVDRKYSEDIEDTLETLNRIKSQAASNQDLRLDAGIQWRIELLTNFKDPAKISTPAGSVPDQLYKTRHSLMAEEITDTVESTGFRTKLRDFRNKFVARPSQGLNAPSMASGDVETKRILLVGHTGTGKSTLFRTLTNKYAATSTGRSCTQTIQRETCQLKDGTTIECINTPGFGDPDVKDFDNLRTICEFLKTESAAGRNLHSVFYHINLGRNRVDRSAKHQAKVFKELIGVDAWKSVCFVYTCGVTSKQAKLDRLLRVKRMQEHENAQEDHKDLFEEAKSNGAAFVELGLESGSDGMLFEDPFATSQSEPDDLASESELDDDFSDLDVDMNSKNKDKEPSASTNNYQPADYKQGTFQNGIPRPQQASDFS